MCFTAAITFDSESKPTLRADLVNVRKVKDLQYGELSRSQAEFYSTQEGRGSCSRTAEEMSLRELRKARKLTQTRVAKALGITQDSVSRLEKRSDLLLSTLRKTIKAMGGDVRIVAQFPDRAPVVLSQLSEEHPRHKSSRKYARRAAAR